MGSVPSSSDAGGCHVSAVSYGQGAVLNIWLDETHVLTPAPRVGAWPCPGRGWTAEGPTYWGSGSARVIYCLQGVGNFWRLFWLWEMAREATSPILMRNYLLCPEKPCSRTRILVGPSGTQLCETCFLILTKKYFCSSWGSCLPLTWDTSILPQLSIHVFAFQQTTSLWS